MDVADKLFRLLFRALLEKAMLLNPSVETTKLKVAVELTGFSLFRIKTVAEVVYKLKPLYPGDFARVKVERAIKLLSESVETCTSRV